MWVTGPTAVPPSCVITHVAQNTKSLRRSSQARVCAGGAVDPREAQEVHLRVAESTVCQPHHASKIPVSSSLMPERNNERRQHPSRGRAVVVLSRECRVARHRFATSTTCC